MPVPAKEFWVLVGGTLLFFLVALLSLAAYQAYQTEKIARKEVTTALYDVVLETMKSGTGDLSPHYLYRMIPVDARPGFMGYVASWAKETVALADQPVREFLKSVPEKGVGVRVGVMGLGQSDHNPQNYSYGVRIYDVFANTPAARAGLCKGDQILTIDGEAMSVSVPSEKVADQTRLLSERAADKLLENKENTTLQVDRYGKKLTIRISEHNAFEHLRDHEKVMNDWAAASQVVLTRLGTEMGKIELLSEAPSNSPIIRLGTDLVAGTLKELLQSHGELRDLRANFMNNLQPLAPECKK